MSDARETPKGEKATAGGEPKATKAPAAKKPTTKKPAAKKKPATPKKPAPIGRPPMYSTELAVAVCALIAQGKSMKTIAQTEGMPSIGTMYGWLANNPEFLKLYERAKQDQADALAEEMLDIADDGTNDWMEAHDKDGNCVGYKVNGEHVQRSRLRIDARKWIAERMKPKRYGARAEMTHGVTDPLAQLLGVSTGALKAQQTPHDDD